ncbi:hypothetical protein ALO35_200072 [Pseudomonas amygdali pv. lachrymans]|uniref:Uncharacterized protein n=1 Tax=Pseudomonas amygdali pv. lachrymans TaxID=53707 RepID=A0A0P9VYT2_PSEAV|nr:hypothetical protein ALO35_200072 [Pseudomonas amygdali pv. lachrymans]
MALDHFVNADLQLAGHISQVFAVVMHGYFNQLAGLASAAANVTRGNLRRQRLETDGGRAKMHQQRPGRRNDFLHACDGPLL